MSAIISLKMRVREERSSAKIGATVPDEHPVPPVAREGSAAASSAEAVAIGFASGAWSSPWRCLTERTPTWSRGGSSAAVSVRRVERSGKRRRGECIFVGRLGK